jgi:hypothetical protein
MDGTLLDSSMKISDKNKQALLRAQEKGVHVVIASGRCIPTLREFAAELGLQPNGFHILALNGAAAYDGFGRQIKEIRMGNKLVSYILDKILPLGMLIIAYSETDKMYVKLPEDGGRVKIDEYHRVSMADMVFSDDLERDLPDGLFKILILGENGRLRRVEQWMKENAAEEEYGMFFSGSELLEFTHPNSSKGQGLDFICRRLGIDMKTEAIAVGDSFNDFDMIQGAALGVCMKNGYGEIKAIAKYVTERDNDGCGVAEAVERFILRG